VEFEKFPKIPRLMREIIVTEKIDGTNTQVVVWDVREEPLPTEVPWIWSQGDLFVAAGSRTRWLTIANDNYGFARWVEAHAAELVTGLGHGRHYGEWWGQGIQRGYGLKEKRFSLFNTGHWSEARPNCCHVVPILYQGPFSQEAIAQCIQTLRVRGSYAAYPFDRPEGIVIFHTAANSMFKITLEKDDQPKGVRNAV